MLVRFEGLANGGFLNGANRLNAIKSPIVLLISVGVAS